MNEPIRVRVPAPLASELLKEPGVVRARSSRGPSVDDIVTVALGGLSTASSIVTLALGAPILYRMFAGLLELGRTEESISEGAVEITITKGGAVNSICVAQDDPAAESTCVRFVLAQFDGTDSSQ